MNEECLLYEKKKLKTSIITIISQIMIFIFFLLVWEILSRLEIINSFIFSKPSSILKLLKVYIDDRTLFKHISISVYETCMGIVIGSSGGIFIAFLLWYFPWFERLFKPFLNVLNALPKTALAPIMIIWAGTGVRGIVVVAISILLVITILSSLNYFLSVDEEKITMMKSFQATRLQIFTKLVFPSNLHNLMHTIKINVGMSWIGVIVGEYIVSRKGIGYLIMYGGQIFKLDLVMMGVAVLAVLAFLMYYLVDVIEKILLKGRE